MRSEVILAPEAEEDLKRLKTRVRAEVRDAIGRHLPHEPTKTNRSQAKRLRGLSKPQYRLRVGEVRVFCDVSGLYVEVLAIVAKVGAGGRLEKAGEPI
jgi:mRNA-degrading endonuclease RelE of RelBE toxin-antitoxin system